MKWRAPAASAVLVVAASSHAFLRGIAFDGIWDPANTDASFGPAFSGKWLMESTLPDQVASPAVGAYRATLPNYYFELNFTLNGNPITIKSEPPIVWQGTSGFDFYVPENPSPPRDFEALLAQTGGYDPDVLGRYYMARNAVVMLRDPLSNFSSDQFTEAVFNDHNWTSTFMRVQIQQTTYFEVGGVRDFDFRFFDAQSLSFIVRDFAVPAPAPLLSLAVGLLGFSLRRRRPRP